MTVESVTSETLVEFNNARMRITPEAIPEVKTAVEEVRADGAPEEVKEVKEAEPAPKKNKLESRFSEITEARRKAEERATELEAEVAQWKAKATPKTVEKAANDDEIGPEPKPAEYTDAFEYAKDLAQWSTNKALKERDANEAKAKVDKERETVIGTWRERVEAVKLARPDWADLVASSKASVSDPARDTIIESKFGPDILGDLAEDDELAAKVTAMKPADQIKWIGRMEAKYEAAQKEPEEKPEPVAKERPKAPAPITPVKGTRTADNPVTSDGEFTGSFKEWKAARKKQGAQFV